MTRILALILCIALLAQHQARFSVVGVYELRKDFVARNLCENRSRPELKCCGKCVLQKQLVKADDQSGASKNEPKKTEQPECVATLFRRAIEVKSFSPVFVLKPYNPRRQRMYHSEPESAIFHPPLA